MTREDAIRRIKARFDKWALDDEDMKAIQTLIPELAESEDERIRKHLIEIVETYWGTTNDPGKAADLAYLEKQKELFKLGRGLYYYDGEKTVGMGYPATEENPYDFAMKQQEEKQKESVTDSSKTSADDNERIREAIEGALRVYGKTQGEWIGGYDMDTLVVHLRGAFSTLEKQKERSMSAEEVLIKAGLKPYKDGNQWCILAGDNIQEGICGFGDTIDEALYQFLMEVLEMQKEQKPLMRDEEIEDKKRDIVAAIRKCYSADYAEYLTSFLKELSPEDNSEDEYGQKMLAIAYKLMYEHIPENLRTQEFWDALKYMREYTGRVAIIHSYHKPAEWNEEDEGELQNAIDALEFLGKKGVYKSESGYDAALQAASWLKDFPERFTIQPKEEWSEEDKKMLWIIQLALTKHPITDKQEKDAFDWLNSLRPQPRVKTNDYITPHKEFFEWIYNRLINVHNENPNVDYMQSFRKRIDNLQFDEPQWKPSEEQMDALRASNSYWKGTTNEVPRTDLLESLYNDLEKLIAKR